MTKTIPIHFKKLEDYFKENQFFYGQKVIIFVESANYTLFVFNCKNNAMLGKNRAHL